MTDIYQALSAVMAEVDHVAKRDVNQHQKFNFRGIDAVVNAVGPALRKHKVIVIPMLESVEYETVATTTGKPSTACRVSVSYVFYAPDGSSIETKVAAEAWDAGDKACPKAMSVAFRTALLQSLALPTDEPDPDSQTYERAPQEDMRTLILREAKRLEPDLTDEELRNWINAELTSLGGNTAANQRELLGIWRSR